MRSLHYQKDSEEMRNRYRNIIMYDSRQISVNNLYSVETVKFRRDRQKHHKINSTTKNYKDF